VHSNKYNWTRLSKSVSWIYKKSPTSSIQCLGDVHHDNQGIAAISQVHLPSNSPDLTAADFFISGYLKAQVFTHTLPDINSLTNAIRQDIVNVTQDNLHRVMASVPGRRQQCLDCHGGHLQDIVLKTWGFFCESNTLTYLTVFSCIYCCIQ
jgi:hypothetical protein